MAIKKTRNNNTMTEAAYWGMIRSGLRKTFRYWKPILKCKQEARKAYKGKNKRQKWQYQCNKCKEWFKEKEIAVDHIIPVGSIKCYEDLPGFVKRLSTEEGYQVLCKECHNIKTQEERKIQRDEKGELK